MGVSQFVASAAVGFVLGAAIGIGAYAFLYARGASYLVDDPSACANCHVMLDVYGAWIASSHSKFATCNDCHTPRPFLRKYATKFSSGLRHSVAFTTGWFPEPIRIGSGSLGVVEEACRTCHGELAAAIEAHSGNRENCVRCHNSVGHLE